MRTLLFLTCGVVIANLISINSYGLEPAFLQKVQSEEQTAYEEICSGKYREGLRRLVYLFREMPADDVECADIMISPVQLFLFGIEQYMGGKFGTIEFERGIGENRIEDFGKYPTDELVSGLVLLNEKDMMKYTGYVKLYKLTSSSHRGVQFISSVICMLGMPREFFKEDPIQFSMNTFEMAKPYKDLGIVRQMSLLPVLEYVEKEYVSDVENRRYFMERLVESIGAYGTGVILGVGTEMPSLGCMLSKITELEQERFMLEVGIQRLAQSIVEEQDSICQYGELVLLSKLGRYMQWDEGVRSSLEEVIRKTVVKGAVHIRAKLLLAEYLQKGHEEKRIRELGQEMLGWGVLPGVIDTNLYREQVRVLEGMGRYYLKYGWYSEAKEVYEGLSKKYTGSKIGKEALSWWKQIERSPVEASLEVIAGDVERSRNKGEIEKVKAYYQEIAEHTPNADLRARLEAQQERAGEKLEYRGRLNEFEEVIFSNPDPALKPIRDALIHNKNEQ